MSSISEWSTKEEENTHLDSLTLSGEGGQYINKVMCAVKGKMNEVDGKLDAVAGGLVFRGTKATYSDLEAVTSPAVGDMYSVTELGGENYAWNGTVWDDLGTSDANVVHKTGNESVGGEKTFTGTVKLNDIIVTTTNSIRRDLDTGRLILAGGSGVASGASINLVGGEESSGAFMLTARLKGETGVDFYGKPDGTLTWGGQEIQTSSDERIKTAMAAVPDAVLDAWEAVQWGQFKFLKAIELKGDPAARLHLGLIAQHVTAVFEEHGLDACAYGIVCHEVREAEEGRPAVDLWMVRYAEAFAMEAAFQRRRADMFETRLAALEARLGID